MSNNGQAKHPDIASLLSQANAHHQAGRRQQAEQIYRDILNSDPSQADTLHQLGLLQFGNGALEQAVKSISQAIDKRSMEPIFHNNLGNVLKALGKLPQAANSFKRALSLRPEYVIAHNNLGSVHQELGRLQDAEDCYRKALRLHAGYVTAKANLGRVLHKQGRFDEAIETLQEALQQQPDNPVLYGDLGNVLLDCGAAEQAIDAYRRLLDFKPQDPDVHICLGRALHQAGHLEDAVDCFKETLALAPEHAAAQKFLGIVFQDQGRLQDAARQYRLAMDLNPGDASVGHLLAALNGEQTESAPREYVIDLFDEYAGRFETHLASLDYHVPQRMREMVITATGCDSAKWRVIDLGCGTGLAGEQFRSFADHLTGIDLSSRMVEQARQRSVYDKLITGDLVESLHHIHRPVELVLATDVFIYIGNLHPVFAAVKKILADNGLFAFSTEAAEGDQFYLGKHGRYAHPQAYIDSLAEAYHFTIIGQEDMLIRAGAEPIHGEIVILQRSNE